MHDVFLTAPTGQGSVVLGLSGIGKTILLKYLVGVRPIKSEQRLLESKDISELFPEQRVRYGLAYMT